MRLPFLVVFDRPSRTGLPPRLRSPWIPTALDGLIVVSAFLRSRDDGNLTLQVASSEDESQQVAELPIKVGCVFSVPWDFARAQALIAVRASVSLGATQLDHRLVRYGAEVAA